MTPSLGTLFAVFLRIGVISFGGPAAQIALLHRELVDERGWLTDREFVDALGFCMLLPGPEAMQLATWCGWRLHGVRGGLIAGGLFVLPGALVIAVLALGYARWGAHPETGAALLGIKAAVIVFLVHALHRLAHRALKSRQAWIIAALAFVALYAFDVPFPVLVIVAGLFGWLSATTAANPATPWPTHGTSATTVAVWTGLWLSPLPMLWATGQDLLLALGGFFAKLAVVTFGGAYAVLAYMTQEVVETRGWLTAPQMMDALGLAETTPGPLILVTQFVGMVTGFQSGGVPLGLAAGALTLWMTFVPCFLFIFAGAPYISALSTRARPKAALAAISAAVVGVIATLALWFTVHVLFQDLTTFRLGPVSLELPVLSSLNLPALVLVGLAALLLGPLKRGPLLTVPVMALAGSLIGMVAGN